MIIRDAKPEDFAAIEMIHGAMQNDYLFPFAVNSEGKREDSPLFFVRKVAEEDGRVVGACFLRLTAETYLWLTPELDAAEKMKAMQQMQPAVLFEAYSQGIDDIEARIPETVERRFHKRLKQLGWFKARPGWFPWSRATQ